MESNQLNRESLAARRILENRYMDTAEFKAEYEAWLDDLKDELEKLP